MIERLATAPAPSVEEGGAHAIPAMTRRKREWKPPAPECAYLRLADFPPLYHLSVATTYRLAINKVLPFIRPPGTRAMLFPRARVERILASWENNGGRRRGRR